MSNGNSLFCLLYLAKGTDESEIETHKIKRKKGGIGEGMTKSSIKLY